MAKTDLILLAIDDGQVLRLFEKALEAGSYNVAISRDRPSLDKALQESSPALMIISHEFDKASGFEIASLSLERFPTLPILLFLEQNSTENLKRALQIGVRDCLFAPLKIDDISWAVENGIKYANRVGDWTRHEVKRTTASLQQRVQELQKFDTIIQQIKDSVIIVDDKSNILSVNPAARSAFGLRQEETMGGKLVSDVLPHPVIVDLLNDESDNAIPHHEIVFGDGRVLSAQCTIVPGIGKVITMQDISYLKQIDRLKNEFVNTVSHDLRSPLTAILGYVDLMGRVGPVNDQQREYIHRVQISVESITTLVNDLLELSRIEAGLDSQRDSVPIEKITQYALDALSNKISEKQLNVIMNCPENIPPIHGNQVRLRQMLDNLIDNAVKYTPESGVITIELREQTGQIILRISDTGPGIPPADQPHIFEKFYRASNVPKGVAGSGLGLAIVKSIADSHQGRIWVESFLGKGSTFIVVLPINPREITPPKLNPLDVR
jgi:signal transduction histidine kinase